MIALILPKDILDFSLTIWIDIKTTTKRGGLANSPEALRIAGEISPD
jgi:hypothetical protein